LRANLLRGVIMPRKHSVTKAVKKKIAKKKAAKKRPVKKKVKKKK